MNEVESIIKSNYDNDYNDVLEIFPQLDSTLATSYQEQIDDCIKKASIAIQRHKNSKWVDDSYVYIGRARHRSLDYVNAIETYKFVNTNSEDDNARHEALARLLRTFVDAGEYENATAVEDYLKKEKLNRHNQKLLSLHKAHHYQTVGDYDKMVENLVEAAPELTRRDDKGRIYFIIGQVYQKLGFDAEAFNYYRRCLASNPEYELDFYTRLNMAQVTQLGKSSDVKSARKLLNTLLKDPKNKEFKDKIYYEIGQFELKQGNITTAIDNYKSSVESSVSNQRQKGQSYLRLGEVYYDTLSNYELAQSYYDSAVQSLPQDFSGITAIKARAEVLKDFVKQLKTIELQDSLLLLASLDSASIAVKLNSIIEAEDERKREAQKKAERKEKRAQFNAALNNSTGITSTAWYFGNPSAVAQGQSEFQRIWGNRPLEDNWRRSDKASFQNDFDSQNNVSQNSEVAMEDTEVASLEDGEDNRFMTMYGQIPFDEESKLKANESIENAFYALGNIYKYQLNEDKNAAETFEQLIDRYPDSEYKPEVLYQLYLIHKQLDDSLDEKYKNDILTQFPKSVYAKLILNPNYTEESTAANEKLKGIYKVAYNYFNNAEYDTANFILDQALSEYEETVFTPNIKLLKVLITGRTEDITLYQYQLGDFIQNYPDADIKPYAEKLLEASRSFQEKKRKRLGTQYVQYLEQSHYFVYLYQTKSGLSDVVSSTISEFDNTNNYSTLRSSNLILNDELAMILISDFEDKDRAMDYFELFTTKDPVNEPIRNSKFYKFVITKDNFNIFYQSKDLDTYLLFFEKNYLNEFN